MNRDLEALKTYLRAKFDQEERDALANINDKRDLINRLDEFGDKADAVLLGFAATYDDRDDFRDEWRIRKD